MPRWKIEYTDLAQARLRVYVTDRLLIDSVKFTNKQFAIWKDLASKDIMVEAMNKPIDLIKHGLHWKLV